LGDTVNLVDDATKNQSVDVLWKKMHPDDKVRWADEAEYAALFKQLNSQPIKGIQVKETIDVPSWTHPVTKKVYTNIKKVLVNMTYAGSDTPVMNATYFQQVGNDWYFFTSFYSQQDRLKVKAEAKPGPSYKELSKDPDKFKGVYAKYTGQIAQIQEGQNGSGIIRLNITKNEYGSWNDTIYVSYSQSNDAVQDDIITVYGIITGIVTYTSQANYNITLPGLDAMAIEKK
jgi:hypothetical protein